MKLPHLLKNALLSVCLCGTAIQGADVHSLANLGHEFSFYADGRFQKQYLPQEKGMRNWGNLHQVDSSNLNLLIFLGCDHRISYTPKDFAYIGQFLKEGGGVLLAGYEGNKGQAQMAKMAGASFGPQAKAPFKPTAALKKIAPSANEIEGKRQSTLIFEQPEKWTVLVVDAAGKPLIAQRKVGHGNFILASRGLFGHRPDAKDNINAAWVSPLLKEAAKNKSVDSGKALPDGGLDATNTKRTDKGLTVFYSDYLAHCYDGMVEIVDKSLPLIEKRMGVPLSKNMGSSIALLATGGGGFSSGRLVALAVFWENFPVEQQGMYEFLTHEFVHSWVLPHPEVWNEPIATYVGNLVMCDAGFKEEGEKRIKNNMQRALRIDPTMKLYDINGNGAQQLNNHQKNEIHWGKTYWVFEELRKLDPHFMAKYFQAKRAYVPAKLSARYDMNDTVAIISQALNRDMYPWFNAHGMPCSYEQVKPEIKAKISPIK